jgi:hypothetical protein
MQTVQDQKRWRLLPIKNRFARDAKGSTMVEFALLIVPFLACLFAIVEIGLVFFAGQTLETAVGDASRLIMTGQAQAYSSTDFQNQICWNPPSDPNAPQPPSPPGAAKALTTLFDCTKIQVDVQVLGAFSSTSMAPPTAIDPNTGLPTAGGGAYTGNFSYSVGTPCSIMAVRVVYEWPTFVRYLGLDLATLPNGKRLLMATAAFRNEPYSGTSFC